MGYKNIFSKFAEMNLSVEKGEEKITTYVKLCRRKYIFLTFLHVTTKLSKQKTEKHKKVEPVGLEPTVSRLKGDYFTN